MVFTVLLVDFPPPSSLVPAWAEGVGSIEDLLPDRLLSSLRCMLLKTSAAIPDVSSLFGNDWILKVLVPIGLFQFYLVYQHKYI